MKIVHSSVTVFLLCTGVAVAAVPEDLSQRLKACGAIATAEARLACYDTLTAGLAVPGSSGTQTPTDSPATAAAEPPVARDPAAAEPPATPADPAATFGAPKVVEKTEPEELIAQVARVERTPYGKLVLHLDNGQVWQQLDSRRSTIRAGDTIRIRVTLSGAYQLNKEEGGSSIQVRRTDV